MSEPGEQGDDASRASEQSTVSSSRPVFMSPRHVAQMNAILERDEAVRRACAELETPVTMGYELADGPDGETVHWSMSFGDTVRFGLEKVDADLLFCGDWKRMVRASRASRDGNPEDPGVVPVGDLALLETVGPVFALAQGVATIPVEFPDV
jgi:hypothetical protein